MSNTRIFLSREETVVKTRTVEVDEYILADYLGKSPEKASAEEIAMAVVELQDDDLVEHSDLDVMEINGITRVRAGRRGRSKFTAIKPKKLFEKGHKIFRKYRK